MRLVCPNCGAQYEVADDLIPRAGRDVQCSSCGNTWFEVPGRGAMPPPEPAPRIVPAPRAAAPVPDPQDGPEPDDEPEPEPEPAVHVPPAVAAEPARADAQADARVTPPGQAPGQAPVASPVVSPAVATGIRSTVTPAVAQILREEAAREAAVRRAEAAALETQPDLGLDRAISELVADTNRQIPAPTIPAPIPPAPETRQAEEARRKMARLRGEPEAGPEPRPDAPGADPDLPHGANPTSAPTGAPQRRAVFPDIEQINSTLRSAAERAAAEAESPEVVIRTRRRGFRAGFSIIVVFALLLALVYVLADPITAALPQFKAPLDGYVAQVDAGRLWLDLRLQDLLAMLQGDAAPGTDPAPATAPQAAPATAPEAAPAAAPEAAPAAPETAGG